MKNKLKISVQGKPSSDNKTLLLLYINFGQVEKQSEELQLPEAEFDEQGQQYFAVVSVQKNKYKPVKVSSGISLPSTFWNSKNKTALGVYAHLNDRLKNIIDSIHLLYNELIKSDKFTSELLQNTIKQQIILPFKTTENNGTIKLELKPAVQIIPTILTDYIKLKMKEWGSGINPKGTKTIVNHNKFLNWIIKYQKEKGFVFDLKTTSTDDVKNYISWFANQSQKSGEPYKLSYVNFQKTQFKIFINEITNEDDVVLPHLNLKKKFMTKKNEEVDDIYLSMNEIKAIKDLQFDADESLLEQVRDLFLVGCFSGFRWQTLSILTKNNFYQDEQGNWNFTVSKTRKTKASVDIPVLDDCVLNIYKKYGQAFPKIIDSKQTYKNIRTGKPIIGTEKTFNKLIKVIGQRALLTKDVVISSLHPVTLEPITKEKKQWEMLSSKVCRKSFASNLIRFYDVPLFIAMSYLGHKKEETFKKYIRLTIREYAQISHKQMSRTAMKVA